MPRRRVKPQKVADAVRNVISEELKKPVKKQRKKKQRNRKKKGVNPKGVPISAPSTVTKSWSGTKFRPYVKNGMIGIRACELLTNVTVPKQGYNASTVLYSTTLNPRSFGSGKLRNFSSNYDQFKFEKISVEYVPAQGTSVSGRVNMSFDRDPLDHRTGISGATLDKISGSDQVMKSEPLWHNFNLVAPNNWLNSGKEMLYNDPADNPRWWSQGTFYLQCMGPLFSGSTEVTQLATLYVSYDVLFKDFQLSSVSAGNSFYCSSTVPTDGDWFKGATFNPYNNLELQIVNSTVGSDHNLIYFPSRGVYFLLTYGYWSGTIHTDATFAFPTVNGGNTVSSIAYDAEDSTKRFPIEDDTTSGSQGPGLYFFHIRINSPSIPLSLTQVTGNQPDNMYFFCWLGNEPVPIDPLPQRDLTGVVDSILERLRLLEVKQVPSGSISDPHTGKYLVTNDVVSVVSNTPNVSVTNTPDVSVVNGVTDPVPVESITPVGDDMLVRLAEVLS